MPLQSASRFGAYEIVGLIGQGGPLPLALEGARELRRGLAEAQQRPGR